MNTDKIIVNYLHFSGRFELIKIIMMKIKDHSNFPGIQRLFKTVRILTAWTLTIFELL